MVLGDLLSLGIFLVGLSIVAVGLWLCRGRRRSVEPTCPKCHYALRGLPGVEREGDAYEPVACPECGHAAGKRINLFCRQRRPVWLGLVAVGIAVLCEPLYLGYESNVYDHLPDSAIVHLHAKWNDRYAGWVVEDRFRSQSNSLLAPFSDPDMLTLAEGAIGRIERATARGEPEAVDTIELLILSRTKIWHPAHTPPAFASRVARAMPPLFAHPDEQTRWSAAWLSCDFHDPSATVAAVIDAQDDPDPHVRAAAAESLFTHLDQGQDVAEAFVRLLDDPDPDVRTAASDRLRQYAVRSDPPACLGPALEALEPAHRDAARARAIAMMAMLPGEERIEACRARLREGTNEQRWEALLFVSHRPALVAALLPDWGKEHGGDIQDWLRARRRRPAGELLEELGFERDRCSRSRTKPLAPEQTPR